MWAALRDFVRGNQQAIILGAVIMGATTLGEVLRNQFQRVRSIFLEYFYVQLEVYSYQPEYDMLLTWLAQQPIAGTTNNLGIKTLRSRPSDDDENDGETAKTALEAAVHSRELLSASRRELDRRMALAEALLRERNGVAGEDAPSVERIMEDATAAAAATNVAAEDKAWMTQLTAAVEPNDDVFVPGFGTHRVKFQGRTMWLTRDIDDSRKGSIQAEDRSLDEIITIVYFGRSRKVVEDLLAEARLCTAKTRITRTPIYINRYGCWDSLCYKPKRFLPSVFLPPDVSSVVAEVKEFLTQRDLYQALGLPWRRGYMLTGPPGTGKSSLIQTVAGECNLPIYVLSRDRSICDAKFLEIVNSIPREKSLLVIEDADTALGLAPPAAAESAAGDDASDGPATKPSELSLSGVLNALDGIASSEGRILFMTSNAAPETFPPALVRPGRVDRVVHVGYMEPPAVDRMLRHMGCGSDRAARAAAELGGSITPAEVQAAVQLDGMRCSDKAMARLADQARKRRDEAAAV